MVDRENVIKGLEHCAEKLDTIVNRNHGFNCIECPYIKKCEHVGSLIGLPLMRDALALLKAQEPVSPMPTNGHIGSPIWICGNCKSWIGSKMVSYCWHCGRAVKWND